MHPILMTPIGRVRNAVHGEWPLTALPSAAKPDPTEWGRRFAGCSRSTSCSLQSSCLDAFHGTPVFDIKPVLGEFLPAKDDIRQPQWSRELMAKYFLIEGTTGE